MRTTLSMTPTTENPLLTISVSVSHTRILRIVVNCALRVY